MIKCSAACSLTLLLLTLAPFFVVLADTAEPIKIGWIGDMSGPTEKWGMHKAAKIAEDQVNSSGGINGRKLKLIYEDARCNSVKAITAYKKLTKIDGVKIILGGHCSPESLAFASIANREEVLMLAAATSSPEITKAGDNVFRMTPISTKLADLIAPYVFSELNIKKLGVIYEVTDYVEPVALKLQQNFKQLGGEIPLIAPFHSGENDFRVIFSKAAALNLEAIYIGTQAPDTMEILLKQLKTIQSDIVVLANEQARPLLTTLPTNTKNKLLDKLIFAEAECKVDSPNYQSFTRQFKKNYNEKVPFACYTPEAYDAVLIIAEALRKCSENHSCLKQYLYQLKDFPGASGTINFDKHGDNSRPYRLRIIENGQEVS